MQSPEQLDAIIEGLEFYARRNRTYRTVGNAIARIAEGVREGLPRNSPAMVSAEILRRELEGETSVEELIAAAPPRRSQGGDPRGLQTYDWLLQWLRESSQEERRAFC